MGVLSSFWGQTSFSLKQQVQLGASPVTTMCPLPAPCPELLLFFRGCSSPLDSPRLRLVCLLDPTPGHLFQLRPSRSLSRKLLEPQG